MSDSIEERKLNVLSFDVGTKHLALCHMEVHFDKFRILRWSVESCVDAKVNVNLTPISDLAPSFYDFILKSDWSTLPDVDIIFIENQPMGLRGSARNLKTKILSHILQVVLKHNMPKADVHFVNPSLKLKDMIREGPSNYKENKKYAVTKTSEIIASIECVNAEECTDLMSREKKKDDLADSFLQGLLGARMHLDGNVVDPRATKKDSTKRKKTEKKGSNKATEAEKIEKPVKAPVKKKRKVLDESITIEH